MRLSVETYVLHKRYGDKRAVEMQDKKSNCLRALFTPEQMKQMLAALDSPYFFICIDVGHEIFGYLMKVDDQFMETALDFAAKTGRHLLKRIEALGE